MIRPCSEVYTNTCFLRMSLSYLSMYFLREELFCEIAFVFMYVYVCLCLICVCIFVFMCILYAFVCCVFMCACLCVGVCILTLVDNNKNITN